MKRAERLRRLAESRQPDVNITVVLKDMSPQARRGGAPAPPASRSKDSPTATGDVRRTIEARRYVQATQKAAQVRKCSHCRQWVEAPTGEGSGTCSSCGAGGL